MDAPFSFGQRRRGPLRAIGSSCSRGRTTLLSRLAFAYMLYI
jgi:hypothetical protein